ncbi:MAG: hypothetical protein KF705_08510 [Phycisphaeraceae bacterium]|nr:hypothetical protein [Phycisphaeraceae bacterium]
MEEPRVEHDVCAGSDGVSGNRREVGAGGGVLRRPASANELRAFVRDCVGVLVPSRSRDGRGGPMEYLWHAFDDRGENGATRDGVVWACRGGGKTLLGAIATVADLVFNDGIQVRILAGSVEQGSRMHEHLRRAFTRAELAPLVRGRITERRIELRNGSRVELLAQSQQSVRGTRVHRLRCDEVELFDEEVWEAAQLVTRSETLKTGLVRGSIDALSTMHMPFGLMRRIVGSCAEGKRTLFKWGIAEVLAPCACEPHQREGCAVGEECAMRGGGDEIAGHVSIEDASRQKGRVSREVWESEMLCLRPTRRETVFPEFDESVHVVDALPDGVDASGVWLAGMDFGFRTSVLLWAVHDPRRDRLFIVDERVAHNGLLRDHIEAMRSGAWPVPRWLGVDPAGRATSDQSGRSNVELLRASGFRPGWRSAPTRTGLEMVRARLRPAIGEPRLFVLRRCKGLIEALRSYHFDPKDQWRQMPIKDGHDHAADALRYLVVCLDLGFETSVGSYV